MANQRIPDLTADASPLPTDEYVVHKSGETRAKKQTRATLITGLVPTTRTISTTAPLTGGGDLSANRTLAVSDASTTAKGVVELATSGENAAGVVVQGNDARLSDARTPLAHVHAAADITSGTIATARLATGTADANTFLRGDQTWAVPPSGGAVTERRSRVRLSANQAIPINTETVIIWVTEDVDTDNFHVGANGRLTVPTGQGGLYLVELGIRFSTLSSGLRQITVRLNGSQALVGSTTSGMSGINTLLSCTCLIDLVAGDYVQGTAYTTAAVDAVADQATHMVIRKVN